MSLLLLSLLYAHWEVNLYRQPYFLEETIPLLFLALAPLVHRVWLRGGFRADAGEEGWGGSLQVRARFLPLGETLGFPRKSLWFTLGCGTFLAAYLAGSWGAVLVLMSGQKLPYWAALLLNQMSGWGLFLLPVLYWWLHRDTVSAFGDIFFGGTMVILGGIYQVHHALSDLDAYLIALERYALSGLLATLAYAALLALFVRWRGRKKPASQTA